MTITFGKSTGIIAGDLIYERAASSLALPVNPAEQNHLTISWIKPVTRGDALLLGVGTDQHDNSLYSWVVDGVVLPISGAVRVGSVTDPFYFPVPIRVKSSVLLYITNNNAVAYPNNGIDPADQIPYEGVMVAQWA
jgi:hypothetical protein